MKNFALVISSAALTGVVVWIIMGGLNADPQGSKDNHVVPSEKASVSEVEFRKEMADVKKGLGDLACRISDVEKNYEALWSAKSQMAKWENCGRCANGLKQSLDFKGFCKQIEIDRTQPI